ncbi:adenosylcobinamide kinase /adenosylcobinamide-phosphate guanylyltransferase [Butyrivibrio sp. Su6]|uniref:bifunctional adenosylcobinamide kinase/adenosylcobinamide-phosphate guanylyltransferase n=1 Tax=Butyrivibrio sp. Su6 TaxID=1520810 RepID=UPI00089E6F0D|nr:bifunctional adenosylcobinamide kinase/adenosylcobinamide-phosphate guanylyltransferase [Butyrivibrio sp. Su6]SEF41172.1 adenosylcobinamide kinase /adenosylcobinamide-phosphate guanylyltransferase [Butyrivibrio sp. Su6]
MLVLITGGCKNGKSSKAEIKAFELSGGENLYYLATMIASDNEDKERIQKHIDSRKDMPFTTIEKGRDIDTVIERIPENATVLLDSLTALLSNEMFKTSDAGEYIFCKDAAGKVLKDIEALNERVSNLVIVSDYIQSDAAMYDEYTQHYRNGLAFLEERLCSLSDEAIEIAAGKEMLIKNRTVNEVKTEKRNILVLGGAFQGKKDFVMESFEISPEDIYTFVEDDTEIPSGYRCYEHIERYVYACIKKGKEPVDSFPEKSVIIIDDIFCGVVPMDELIRRYREEAGRFMQKIAAHSDVYRVFCKRGIKL